MGAGREPLSGLDAALEEVHRAFKRARKPEHLKNRMDFLQAREEARLLGRPRKELTAADLRDYVDECGGKLEHPELAYFMPRICEVMGAGESAHPSLGWVCSLNCLEYADFPAAWPDDQVAALQRFVEALLLAYVADRARFTDVENLGELIRMAAKAGIAVEEVLDALSKADGHLLAHSLALWINDACFLSDQQEVNRPEEWRDWLALDVFWIGTDHPKRVCDWIVTLEPWRLLADSVQRETDPDLRASLRRAADYCAAWPEAQKPSA